MRILSRFICLAILLASAWQVNAAGYLPNGKQQIVDANGAPCVGCKLYFYIPSTNVPKDTFIDADQTALNQNPVTLDSLGTATIYGVGTYRQILKDATGVTLWDQIVSDAVSLNAGWGGLSTGSANVQAITVGNYSGQDGQAVYWLAGFTNSSATTLNVSSNGATSIVRDSSSGPVALTGGEIVVGNVVGAIYSSATGQFHLITPTPIQSFDGAVFFNGYITPTILAADQNDWTPSGGFTTANTVRVSSNAAINITGLAGGTTGRQVSFQNIGSFPITFVTQSTSSAAANRFFFSNSIVLNANDSVTVQYDALSSGWRSPALPAALYAPGFIFGCTLSNNVADATNDIDFVACHTRAGSTAANIDTIAMTKRLDADWAAGTNQGMRYSGAAISNTTYHIFTISTATGQSDYFAYTGTDPTAVLPTGYVNYRRIGSIIRTGGAIKAFSQLGNSFLWSIAAIDINNGTGSTVGTLITLTVPAGIQVDAFIVGGGTSGNQSIVFASPDESDQAPVAVTGTVSGNLSVGNAAAGASNVVPHFPVRTNTVAQIRQRSSSAQAYYLFTRGYTDYRGTLQ